MSQTNEEKKTKGAKKRKPLRRAKRWGSEVPSIVGRMLVMMMVIIVLGLMFSALQAIEALWLRALLAATIISGMLLLCFNDGVSKGAQDVGASRFYAQAQTKGLKLTDKDDAACYQPLKALCGMLIVFALPLVLGIYVALTSKGYTYALQDLPMWLSDVYGARADVMAPLAAYAQDTVLTATDWARILARLPIMMFINFFPDPMKMSGLIDKITPMLLLAYPGMYMIGYLVGPKANRKREKMNRRAKKVAVRKAEKKSLVEELVGSQHEVHYGQRNDASKHKKKELV